MTTTLREVIAELDALTGKYIEAVRPSAVAFTAEIRTIAKVAVESDFTEAETTALIIHIDNVIIPRIEAESREMFK